MKIREFFDYVHTLRVVALKDRATNQLDCIISYDDKLQTWIAYNDKIIRKPLSSNNQQRVFDMNIDNNSIVYDEIITIYVNKDAFQEIVSVNHT